MKLKSKIRTYPQSNAALAVVYAAVASGRLALPIHDIHKILLHVTPC